MPPVTKKIRSNIASLRKSVGVTQAQLAVFIGVTTNTIQNWERGNGLDQLEKYLKLCEFFECDIRDLIKYVEVPEETTKQTKSFSVEQVREVRNMLRANVKKSQAKR